MCREFKNMEKSHVLVKPVYLLEVLKLLYALRVK